MHTTASSLPTAPTTGRFRTDPLSPTSVVRAMARARLSPWRVQTITDARTRAAIGDLHLAAWNEHLLESGDLQVIAREEPAGRARDLRRADHFARELHEAPLHLAVLARPGGTLRPGAMDQLTAALAHEDLGAVALPRFAQCREALGELLDLEAQDLMLAGMLIVGARR